jgi:hypothetical protein
MKFLLQSRNFSLRLIFIKCLLGDQLASQILNLQTVLLFDGFIFLPHDVSPDHIEFVQDLTDACFSHFWLKSLLDFSNLLDGISWNPLVCISIFSSSSSSLSFVGGNAKSIAFVSNTLVSKVFGLSHNLNVIKILVLTTAFQQLDQLIIVSFHIVELNVNRAFSLSRAI